MHGTEDAGVAASTWTSKVPKIVAQYAKTQSTGRIGSIGLRILEVQVLQVVQQRFRSKDQANGPRCNRVL